MNSDKSITPEKMRKPSERIDELLKVIRDKNPGCHEDGIMLGLAIMNYLDEQAELHKDDIQITQGR